MSGRAQAEIWLPVPAGLSKAISRIRMTDADLVVRTAPRHRDEARAVPPGPGVLRCRRGSHRRGHTCPDVGLGRGDAVLPRDRGTASLVVADSVIWEPAGTTGGIEASRSESACAVGHGWARCARKPGKSRVPRVLPLNRRDRPKRIGPRDRLISAHEGAAGKRDRAWCARARRELRGVLRR
jgi:hypothetical protein